MVDQHTLQGSFALGVLSVGSCDLGSHFVQLTVDKSLFPKSMRDNFT